MDARGPLERIGRLFIVSAATVRRRQREFGVMADRMDPGAALRFERWLTCVAAAAEELGAGADPMMIISHARELERRGGS